MTKLCLLALVGLVMGKTNPGDFSLMCTTGVCPAGWMKVEEDCVMFMSGWDEAKAREACRENKAEYAEYFISRENSDSATRHSLPVCLVTRQSQCQCGQKNGADRIVGGVDAGKNEFPWQVRLQISTDGHDATCGGSILTRDSILTAAHCTSGEVKTRN